MGIKLRAKFRTWYSFCTSKAWGASPYGHPRRRHWPIRGRGLNVPSPGIGDETECTVHHPDGYPAGPGPPCLLSFFVLSSCFLAVSVLLSFCSSFLLFVPFILSVCLLYLCCSLLACFCLCFSSVLPSPYLCFLHVVLVLCFPVRLSDFTVCALFFLCLVFVAAFVI